MQRAPLLLALAAALAATGCLGGPSTDASEAAPDADTSSNSPPRYRCTLSGTVNAAVCDVPVSEADGATFEPVVAAEPGDPDHVVVSATQQRRGPTDGPWGVLYASQDGGTTWNLTPVPRKGTPLATYLWGGDNDVAVGPDGTVMYAGSVYRQARSFTDGSVFVARSTDGGRTFDEVQIVAPGAYKVLQEQVDVEVAPATGNVYLAWTRQVQDPTYQHPPGPLPIIQVRFARSTDGGRTFTDPVTLTEDPASQAFFPSVAAGPDGRVAVSWTSFRGDEGGGTYVAVSQDGGGTFSEPVRAAPAPTYPDVPVDASSRVTLAADRGTGPSRGRLHLVFPGQSPEGGSVDVGHVASPDGRRRSTWSSPEPLPASSAEAEVGWPTLDVAPGGSLHVLYYRFTGDGSFQPVWTHRQPNGSWSQARTLASAPSDLANAGEYTGLGDYISIEATGDTVHAVWTDLRAEPATLRHAALTAPES